jgi:acyl-CoA thioester hydrolase
VVYHGRYLDFFERARMDWLRAIGFEARHLVDEHAVTFIVRSISVDYRRPARLDDALEVSLAIAQAGGARLTLDQRVACGGETLASALVELACVDCRDLRPTRLPQPLRAACAAWYPSATDRDRLTA